MAEFKVNDANIYYEVQGQGQKPLVLIAGYGCNHTFWEPLIPFLSQDFQILIFDNRGSGQTVSSQKDFTLETIADDVMAMVNFIGWHKPTVIGHSMGGAITQTLAVKYANEIGDILLCNTAAKINAICLMALSNAIKLQKTNIAIDLLIETFLPWVFSEEFVSDSAKVAAYKKAILTYPYPQTIEGNEQQLKALESFNLRTSLNRIRSKTLILGNTRDLFMGEEELQFLKDNIPKARLTLLPGGHATLMENPEKTFDIIQEFLKSSA
jgi:3-oxoadipate enol-lactonase